MERLSRTCYLFFLAGAFLWCVMIFLPTLQLLGAPPNAVSPPAYAAFSKICHQQDERSFHIAGVRLAVCSRCTAIYVSFLFGVIIWRRIPRTIQFPGIWCWAVAVVPMVLDVGLDSINLHPGDFLTRSMTGGWFGLIAGIMLTPLFLKACSDIHSHLSQHRGILYESKTR